MLENVLTDPSSRVTSIDAFFDWPSWDVYSPDLEARFQANVKKAGGHVRVTTIAGLSQEELRKLPLDSYDIIYIDGSHMGPDVLEDAVLSFRLLKPGGMIIFDDYPWKADEPTYGWAEDPDMRGPQLAIDTFMKFFGEHFRIIHHGYQIIMVRNSP